jgi:glutathione S-transferase
MPNELVFYTNPMSRGRIVRWMLEEVGQPYRTEILDFATTLKGPEYLAINPMGKIPAIRHGSAVVTEAAAICAYLADAFPRAGLAPALDQRADYYRWLFFAAGPLEAAATNKMLGFEAAPEQRRMAGYGCLADVLATLEAGLSGRDYLAGDSFSAADVYVGSHIGWGLMQGTIDRRPAFERYLERVGSRPASVRARAIDDALIAEAQKPAAAEA